MLLAPITTYRATLAKSPGGVAGAHHTLRLMRDYIRAGRLDPRIIQAAHSIVFLQPENSGLHECSALFSWVRDSIRYTADVVGVETLAYPVVTYERRSGDCDDQTILLCSLFESIGYPTRLVMTAYQSNDWEHVYCQVLINGEWFDCDPIQRNYPFGAAPGNPRKIFIEAV